MSREFYSQLPTGTTPSLYRALASAADAVDLSSADNARKLTGGNPTIAVSCKFATAAQNVDVTVILYHYDGSTYTPLGVQTANAVAGSYTDGTNYFAPTAFFDTCGANAYEVRLGASSSGNVAAFAWTYGLQPESGA